MKRKQAISNKSFGKLLKLFKKHIMEYKRKTTNYTPFLISFEGYLDQNLKKLHNTYKRKPFHGVSKYVFKTSIGEMKIGFQFDEKFENVNFKMLVKKPGKMKFVRKRQINIKIK